jgi:integrase
MLGEAVRQGLLEYNPCAKVRRLKSVEKKIDILTLEEVRKLFPKNYETIWGNNTVAYGVCRLASLTGMRIGEILGLRGEYVFDDYILVCGQFGNNGYVPYTKTKQDRSIPLIPQYIALLRGFNNGNGFVFSVNGGAVPVTQQYIRQGFRKALIEIGIPKAEIDRRGLTVHSWRHFLNTELLQQGMSIPQVQGVTGHLSKSQTERYNHLSALQLAGVHKAQRAIAGIPEPKKENPQGLTLVKSSDQKSA